MYMLQAGGVVLLVGDSTGLEFREVASKGAAQPYSVCSVCMTFPFDDSSTSTTCLYLSPSQLCLIKREICLRSNGVIR